MRPAPDPSASAVSTTTGSASLTATRHLSPSAGVAPLERSEGEAAAKQPLYRQTKRSRIASEVTLPGGGTIDPMLSTKLLSWLKQTPDRLKLTPEGAAVDRFTDKYVGANVEGRFALRQAAHAAASLSAPSQVPDGYHLITVVMLDIFETFLIPDSTSRGAHAQGMERPEDFVATSSSIMHAAGVSSG
ncbi:hypothetical protein F4810DRAFT_714168 [Camillea tinctor]|nr:hypothetical protein F4810DRAFT_714168 [Camillea tinctor]